MESEYPAPEFLLRGFLSARVDGDAPFGCRRFMRRAARSRNNFRENCSVFEYRAPYLPPTPIQSLSVGVRRPGVIWQMAFLTIRIERGAKDGTTCQRPLGSHWATWTRDFSLYPGQYPPLPLLRGEFIHEAVNTLTVLRPMTQDVSAVAVFRLHQQCQLRS